MIHAYSTGNTPGSKWCHHLAMHDSQPWHRDRAPEICAPVCMLREDGGCERKYPPVIYMCEEWGGTTLPAGARWAAITCWQECQQAQH
jgi:hypothetical protein